MADFSLHLNDDQVQIKDWIHQFAVDVIRPAAQEWDEREEFPFPIVQEAAKIGLYGIEFLMNGMADPTGLTLPVAIEEMSVGFAEIRVEMSKAFHRNTLMVCCSRLCNGRTNKQKRDDA